MVLVLALGIASIILIMLGIIIKSALWLVVLGAVLLLVTFGYVAISGRTT